MSWADGHCPTCGADLVRPVHGDVWEAPLVGGRFSVMMVCSHHDPPHVTGYWHDKVTGQLDPHRHGSIPLPRFMTVFRLVEREAAV